MLGHKLFANRYFMAKWLTFWDFILKSEKYPLSLIHVLGLYLHVFGLKKILEALALASTLRSLSLLQHW